MSEEVPNDYPSRLSWDGSIEDGRLVTVRSLRTVRSCDFTFSLSSLLNDFWSIPCGRERGVGRVFRSPRSGSVFSFSSVSSVCHTLLRKVVRPHSSYFLSGVGVGIKTGWDETFFPTSMLSVVGYSTFKIDLI